MRLIAATSPPPPRLFAGAPSAARRSRRAPARRPRRSRPRPGRPARRTRRELRRQRLGHFVVDRVGLVECDQLGLVVEAGAIGFELVADGAPGGGDVLDIGVDQVEQDAGALDMAEEAVADPGAFGRALDQPGNVGQDEIDALVADDAELGVEGGEGIVADLGLGVGDGVEEGRLAGIGQADQAGVGDAA